MNPTLQKIFNFATKNSPTILTILASGGLVTTAILAVKATPKAIRLIDQQKEEIDICKGDPLQPKEVLQLTWKCYIPAAAVGIASIACIIGANKINLRRNAALASLYGITEAAFKEYQAKVTETIGRNKELKVRDEISGDHVRDNPPSQNEIIFTGKGEVLCYDSWTGRYFKSDIENIRRAVNDLNKSLRTSMFVTLNELYFAIGLAETKQGDLMGWDVDDGVEIIFSSQLTPENEPCLVLNYDVNPRFYRRGD